MTGRLLVVAPHATRSGSTRVLLGLLDALERWGAVDLAVEVMSGGPLGEELAGYGAPLRPNEVPAAVLFNSAIALGAERMLPSSTPAIVYLHESAEVLDTLTPEETARLRAADLVACVSEEVQRGAMAAGVPSERTMVLPPIIVPRSRPEPAEVAGRRTALGVEGPDTLVLGCGEARWAKGADHFVALAGALAPRTDIHFAWVGRRSRAFARLLDHDARSVGASIRWVGEVVDPGPYLAAADLLVVPSRHDAQPLVTIEAAYLGTPSIGYAVGGLRDLAADGGAEVVRYPDLSALSQLVEAHLADPARGVGLVSAAQARAERRQAPAVVASAFVTAIAAILGVSAPAANWYGAAVDQPAARRSPTSTSTSPPRLER